MGEGTVIAPGTNHSRRSDWCDNRDWMPLDPNRRVLSAELGVHVARWAALRRRIRGSRHMPVCWA